MSMECCYSTYCNRPLAIDSCKREKSCTALRMRAAAINLNFGHRFLETIMVDHFLYFAAFLYANVYMCVFNSFVLSFGASRGGWNHLTSLIGLKLLL